MVRHTDSPQKSSNNVTRFCLRKEKEEEKEKENRFFLKTIGSQSWVKIFYACIRLGKSLETNNSVNM